MSPKPARPRTDADRRTARRLNPLPVECESIECMDYQFLPARPATGGSELSSVEMNQKWLGTMTGISAMSATSARHGRSRKLGRGAVNPAVGFSGLTTQRRDTSGRCEKQSWWRNRNVGKVMGNSVRAPARKGPAPRTSEGSVVERLLQRHDAGGLIREAPVLNGSEVTLNGH